MKGLIIGRFPTIALLFNGFYKQLRHNLHVQYDERADETLNDIIKHHEPLTKKLLIKYVNDCMGFATTILDIFLPLISIVLVLVSKVEVKANSDTFMNCLHIGLKRYKTSSESCFHLLHESNQGPNRRNWYSDPLPCIADMLSSTVIKFARPGLTRQLHLKLLKTDGSQF